MSDQPKPTPGEWTAETVDDIARSGLSPWQDVADAHNASLDELRIASNAALAAEREPKCTCVQKGYPDQGCQWHGELKQLRDQPKPTRGEWTVENAGNSWTILRSENGNELGWFSRNSDKPKRIADAHNAALAAEKEKSEAWRVEAVDERVVSKQLREQRDEAIRLLEYKEKQLAASQAAMKEAIEQPYHVDAYRILEEALNGDTAALDAAIAAAQKPLVELLEWIRGDALHGRPDIVRQIEAALAKIGKHGTK